MRTRYLNNDYFTLPPSQRHETIPFLHLPTPISSAVDHHLNFYSSLPDVSLHIDRFPIHSALSSFLFSVLPHKIEIPNPDPSSSVSNYSNSNNALLREADFIFEDQVSDADIEFSKESKTVARSNENEAFMNRFNLKHQSSWTHSWKMYASLRRRGCKCCLTLQRLKIAWKCFCLSH
ncbi:unnamed protein product [Lathyrus sativus]|nr:unnamed protein product [Lathyrus sativus]